MGFDGESSRAVTVKCDGVGVLIVPQGDLDQETVQTFEYCLEDALQTRRSPLRIDLSQISYVDIAAHRAIMRFGYRRERHNLVDQWLIRGQAAVELMFLIHG